MFGAMNAPLKIPELSSADTQHPAVVKLLEVLHPQVLIIQQQSQTLEALKGALHRLHEEIAHLKQHKGQPKIRPSPLEDPRSKDDSPKAGKRPGSAKRRKTEQLAIHETRYLAVKEVPPGSTFKGYQAYTVQDIEIQPHKVRYLIERWATPTGATLRGALPAAVQESHFGPTLVSYILPADLAVIPGLESV